MCGASKVEFSKTFYGRNGLTSWWHTPRWIRLLALVGRSPLTRPVANCWKKMRIGGDLYEIQNKIAKPWNTIALVFSCSRQIQRWSCHSLTHKKTIWRSHLCGLQKITSDPKTWRHSESAQNDLWPKNVTSLRGCTEWPLTQKRDVMHGLRRMTSDPKTWPHSWVAQNDL